MCRAVESPGNVSTCVQCTQSQLIRRIRCPRLLRELFSTCERTASICRRADAVFLLTDHRCDAIEFKPPQKFRHRHLLTRFFFSCVCECAATSRREVNARALAHMCKHCIHGVLESCGKRDSWPSARMQTQSEIFTLYSENEYTHSSDFNRCIYRAGMVFCAGR